jgi:DNA-binding response OmpR family regulator
MNAIRTSNGGGLCVAGPVRTKAPRLVVGLGVSGVAAAVESHFQANGWDVATTKVGADAGKLAHRTKATAVVLAAGAEPESGLLTCAKLTAVRPNVRVILVGPECARLAKFARYAGAAGYLPEGAGVRAIVRAVTGE